MYEGVAERTGEGGNEDLGSAGGSQVLGNLAETDGGVGTDAGLFIVGSFGEVSEQVAIDGAV